MHSRTAACNDIEIIASLCSYHRGVQYCLKQNYDIYLADCTIDLKREAL